MPDPLVMLITGSSRGIGRALAEHYLSRGWFVHGCSRGEAEFNHERYTHHACDVSNEASMRGMMDAIRKQHRRLDALICNAGVASMNHALLTPMSTVEHVMRTNFFGTFLAAREAAKLMHRRGRIVTMGSVAVPLKLAGEAAYAASKAATVSLTQVLAKELGPLGITCNLVGPSPVQTDLIRGVPADKMQALLDQLALPRLGTFEDVANVVDFFLRPESDYVTGQCIYLGGV